MSGEKKAIRKGKDCSLGFYLLAAFIA